MPDESAAAERMTRMFTEYADAVHAYAVTRAGAQAAADVVADTFLVAWRRLEAVPDQPLPWLLATARRVASTHRRASRRREGLSVRLASYAAAGGATEPAADEQVELDSELWQAVDQLPAREREALVLVAWFDLTNAEAAEVVGCSPGTFGVRLHRARQRLRQLLGERDGVVGAAREEEQ